MRVRGSASTEGFSPSRSSRANTKWSIGFFGQPESWISGSAGRTGGMKDQCFCQGAPWAIHRVKSPISRSVSLAAPE